jgi:hypothetical protein
MRKNYRISLDEANITGISFQLWPTSQRIVEHPKMWPTSNITRMFFQLYPTLHGIVELPKMWPTSNITGMFFQLYPTLHGIVEHPKMWQHPTSQECSFSCIQHYMEL